MTRDSGEINRSISGQTRIIRMLSKYQIEMILPIFLYPLFCLPFRNGKEDTQKALKKMDKKRAEEAKILSENMKNKTLSPLNDTRNTSDSHKQIN